MKKNIITFYFVSFLFKEPQSKHKASFYVVVLVQKLQKAQELLRAGFISRLDEAVALLQVFQLVGVHLAKAHKPSLPSNPGSPTAGGRGKRFDYLFLSLSGFLCSLSLSNHK